MVLEYLIDHFPSFNLTLSTLGTCLIVRETLVVLFSTSPQLTGVPKCDRLQMLSETISSALWQIPCRYFWYISSFSTSKLLGSSRRERRNLDSRLVSSCCIWKEKTNLTSYTGGTCKHYNYLSISNGFEEIQKCVRPKTYRSHNWKVQWSILMRL